MRLFGSLVAGALTNRGGLVWRQSVSERLAKFNNLKELYRG